MFLGNCRVTIGNHVIILHMKYRRLRIPGTLWFFTLVTYQRRIIFDNESSIAILNRAIKKVSGMKPYQIEAFVILPDHIHLIMSLPEGDSDYSSRIKMIKTAFTKDNFRDLKELPRNDKGEMRVWQSRFWEHWIRDDKDLERHLDYIHYNPVKHGYVESPDQWVNSSFQDYVKLGMYSANSVESKSIWEGFPSME